MGWGLSWILGVATTVANCPGALWHMVAPEQWLLGALVLGLLWLILWHGRLRWAGLAVTASAFLMWSHTTRPALLVAEDAGLMALMTPQGPALSRGTGSGFVAGIWLENDGAPVDQAIAAGRLPPAENPRHIMAKVGDRQIALVRGKTAFAKLTGCGGADILITDQKDDTGLPCDVYDIVRLRQVGALAFDLDTQSYLSVTTAREVTGNRPWNTPNRSIEKASPITRLAQWFYD